LTPVFNEKHLLWLHQLLQCQSITPIDDGAQSLIHDFLKEIISNIDTHQAHGIATNNTAYYFNNNQPTLVFAGHTDVVPAGQQEWIANPFQLTRLEDRLIGRGIVDMKGAIICFLAALEHMLQYHPLSCPSIMILLTSNEEGCGTQGLQYLLKDIVVPSPSLVIIGEPSSIDIPGDCIKTGRRGSIHAEVDLKGQPYHVAYAGDYHPLYYIEELVAQLKAIDWDCGIDIPFFAKSSFQITKIQTQECVENVIPASLKLRFNIRYSPATSLDICSNLLDQTLKKYPLQSTTRWRQGATPWRSSITDQDIERLLKAHWAYKGYFSTDGGVSDGYKIAAQLTDRIIELGLSHKSAHQINEWTTLNDLKTLTELYIQLMLKITNRSL